MPYIEKLDDIIAPFNTHLNRRYGTAVPALQVNADGTGVVTLTFTPFPEVPIVRGATYMNRISGDVFCMTGRTKVHPNKSLWVEFEDPETGQVFTKAYTDIQAGWFVPVTLGAPETAAMIAATRERQETFMTHMLKQDIYG